MNYPYLYTLQAIESLEISDIGNTCIIANNDLGDEWYLVIRTILGESTIFSYGPSNPDFDTLPPALSCSYYKMQYNEKKLNTLIDKFLNDTCKRITQAREVLLEDIKVYLKDIREILNVETAN